MPPVLKAGSVAVELTAIDTGLLNSLKKAEGGFRGFSKTVMDSLVSLAAMRTAFSGLTVPVQQTFAVFAGFEAGMSKVKAISGATAQSIAAQLGYSRRDFRRYIVRYKIINVHDKRSDNECERVNN